MDFDSGKICPRCGEMTKFSFSGAFCITKNCGWKEERGEASHMKAKFGEPWEKIPIWIGRKNIINKRIMDCVNACSGLDMSNVPAGAVRRLVDEAFRLESTDFQLRDWDTFREALAPFKGA